MITLRNYQNNTISSLKKLMIEGKKRLIMCAPTGSGKTVIFSFMISKAIEKNNRCLILTHRTELLTQANGTLEQFGIKATVVNPKQRKLELENNLYVAMTKTVMARIKKQEYRDWLLSFDLIIIDESHLQDFNNIFQYLPDVYVIGATATPDRKGNQTCLSDFYQGIVNEIKISELIELGYLAKPNSFGVKVDLSEIKTKGGDYDAELMGEAFSKARIYDGVYDNYQRLTPNKKAIIFSPNISSSIKLVEELSKKGLPIKHIDGNSKDREQIIKWYKETPNALLSNVGILTAGFDENTIEVVVLYRATKSLPLFLQMVGRGSRTNENKKEFTILDFGNNITRHGFWEEDREWQLHKKVKEKGVAPVKDCKCCALLRVSIMVCPYCGYEFPQPETRTPIQIELDRLQKTDIDLFKQYKKFIKLEEKAFEKGYKKGWVLYQLKSEQDFIDYGKFKNYKPQWATFQIERRGFDTGIDSGVF